MKHIEKLSINVEIVGAFIPHYILGDIFSLKFFLSSNWLTSNSIELIDIFIGI